jgi:CheY-like chemotaxis protein
MEILLVEDNPIEAWITQETLAESGLQVHIHHLTEGKQALDFLTKAAPYAEAIKPDLILLDLHMTGMNGVEFLRKMKAYPHLKDIPVVILSTSSHPRDIEETYQYQAVAYLNKPIQLSEIRPILDNLSLFRPVLPIVSEKS